MIQGYGCLTLVLSEDIRVTAAGLGHHDDFQLASCYHCSTGGFRPEADIQLNTAFILLMTKNRKFQSAPALCLLGTVIAGAASTRSIPYDWFLSMLGYSILVALILAVLATVDLKNERRAPIPVALLLESLWLPSRNAEVKLGTILWAFLGMAGFVTGMLGTALLLPIFDAASG